MAGFKTHITTSTVLGIVYGAAGYTLLGVRLETSLLATGLCSLSGMLPDLDSDTGIPLRESIAFGAAVVPMLLVDRLQNHLSMAPDLMVLTGALIYLVIRFGLAEILKRYTVHRGMWHSVPAAAIAGLTAYLLCSNHHGPFDHLFKTLAVVMGFMSHLILDEIYSIEFKYRLPRFKKSFGTAVKFWSKSTWANISTYGKLAILIFLIVLQNGHMGYENEWTFIQEHWQEIAKPWIDNVIR